MNRSSTDGSCVVLGAWIGASHGQKCVKNAVIRSTVFSGLVRLKVREALVRSRVNQMNSVRFL